MAKQGQSRSPQPIDPAKAQAYWQRNVKVITWLLVIWALVSYVFGILLAPVLAFIKIGQIPLGFWFAQQGSIVIFVILIFVYCWIMDRIDREFDVQE